MSKEKETHIERTASEPRDSSLHTLTISSITQVTPSIRLFRLAIAPNDSVKFLPGQWVDLYPPPTANIPKPGGFTITSSPRLAQAQTQPSSSTPNPLGQPPNSEQATSPYIELAIQSSPLNPPAAYLFQPASSLLHTPVQVRIGGSFTFPPPLSPSNANYPTPQFSFGKVVFVASGMGINPLMSMLSWIGEPKQQGRGEELEVRMLYGVRDSRDQAGQQILFLERIVDVFEKAGVKGGVELFLTGDEGTDKRREVVECNGVDVPVQRRRMTVRDVEEAVGEDKQSAVVYICGVPAMTDEFVEALVSSQGFGMEQRRVLFEKWW